MKYDRKVHFGSAGTYSGDTGQVCILRSSVIKVVAAKNAKVHIFGLKTTIGNNSGSVEDIAVKFACNMEFSAVADRMK